MNAQSDFLESIRIRYPGLVEKIQAVIVESENKYSGGASAASHLWEHTNHVAGFAHRLALAEKKDPFVPVIAALLHDAGKFEGGQYHQGGRPEEDAAAALALPILRESGMGTARAAGILSAVRALYDDRARKSATADIVHDADFLSKTGLLGVANFFIKSTLRGRTLRGALMDFLSRELTYAAVLPVNMRTASGKKMAERKSMDTLRFFKGLLRELKDSRLDEFEVRRADVQTASKRVRRVPVRLVVPKTCDACGGGWTVTFTVERGIKCEKLEADVRCLKCGGRYGIEFCLPELPAR